MLRIIVLIAQINEYGGSGDCENENIKVNGWSALAGAFNCAWCLFAFTYNGRAIGLAVKKSEPELARVLQKAMDELVASGELLKLFGKFGVSVVTP
jgi:hypothetical protein